MRVKPFFDTSVLVYLLIRNDPKRPVAEGLLQSGGIVSVQVLNEIANVCRRKLKLPWDGVEEALRAVRLFCDEPISVTLDLHELGLGIAKRYRYSIYDSMLLAAALQAKCSVIYSEDMQDGQALGDLTIRNPFKALLQ